MEHYQLAGSGRSNTRQAWRLLLCCTLTLAFFLLAARLDLAERLTQSLWRQEHWQLDELALSLLVLALALAGFAVRRGRQVALLLAQNRALTQRLLHAQEEERCALARELHDEVGQDCTAIRAAASYILRARDGDQANVQACAASIARSSEALHAMVRTMLRRLRPPVLDSLGLAPALQALCDSWAQQHGIACHFAPQAIPDSLDDCTATAIYRLVQEGLTNVARHAGADRATVELRADAHGVLHLAIEDNGRGLCPDKTPADGFGMLGMRERVAGLRGHIRWISALGNGLRIEVALAARCAA
ncbi:MULTISPECIES: histidine kinase [unclassified Janthinobacterium]|uniref:histidine kinase n=1 Tax=unclassified Janthinobacterium TaxID=2610881 RepID=UPI00068C2A5F|nr:MULTISPECIES: histidine kinase [unclassified Janthinobacterium]NVI84944.1 two-component sensor histidine kinase [Janthinobacterium sp. BJB401]